MVLTHFFQKPDFSVFYVQVKEYSFYKKSSLPAQRGSEKEKTNPGGGGIRHRHQYWPGGKSRKGYIFDNVKNHLRLLWYFG
jgi:hypothetical protein